MGWNGARAQSLVKWLVDPCFANTSGKFFHGWKGMDRFPTTIFQGRAVSFKERRVPQKTGSSLKIISIDYSSNATWGSSQTLLACYPQRWGWSECLQKTTVWCGWIVKTLKAEYMFHVKIQVYSCIIVSVLVWYVIYLWMLLFSIPVHVCTWRYMYTNMNRHGYVKCLWISPCFLLAAKL